MRRGTRLSLAFALAGLLATAVASAASGPLVLPIPGFAAAGLQVGGVSRLDDGGALIAGSLSGNPRAGAWRPVAVRLLLDGTVDLAYGSEGISSPPVPGAERATALAVNPQSGAAWIGLSGPGAAGSVIALTGGGALDPGFGRGGSIAGLGAGRSPTALAWEPGRILVASGAGPCAGCRITLLSAATGATIATGELAPGCAGETVTSAAFTGAGVALLALNGAGRCPGQLATVTIAGRGGQAQVAAVMSAVPGSTPLRTALLAQHGSALCLGGSSATATEVGPLSAQGDAFAASRASAGRLIAVTALGQGACAALVADPPSGAIIVQTSPRARGVTRDVLPRSFTPLGMFRCNAHLLAVGTDHGATGAVAVVPVRHGPAAAASAASAASAITAARTDGCR